MNPIAQIPRATSTAQFQFAQCWWPRESVLRGSLHFHTLKVRILKALTLCQSVKVKQHYHSQTFKHSAIPRPSLIALLDLRTKNVCTMLHRKSHRIHSKHKSQVISSKERIEKVPYHSSEKRVLCLMKSSSEMLQNLPYFIYMKTQSRLFLFFILCYFIFPPNECPGLWRHRPGHSLGKK